MLALKHKSSDIGNLTTKSHKVLPLSEKMKVLDLIRKEKTSYAEAAKICGKNEASVKCCELGKKGKKLYKFCCCISNWKSYGHSGMINAQLRWKRC